ncbi:DUF6759 domain-containing protein [Chryseobacterium sp.]|uniref:DUF6759 domain-containing protein n=1 Tax=Chryseobacterium sp. TaxID=1871047 RepID=UPI0011C9D92B|nr:DUF6759 domain-containing protein [Chryseobacterium sp.]TXF77213.1 hypothetical protein FUA25_04545 [Chryseobacterium sp.]
MKKIFYFFFILMFSFACSQTKGKPKTTKVTQITAEQAEQSNDPQVIAGFLKANPTHPKVAYLKSKIVTLITAGNNTAAKPTIKPLTKAGLKTAIKKDISKDGVNDKNKKTAAVLNHLFNNDGNKSEAYVNIVNKSKCNLVVKFSGKRYYNLDVPAKNQNFILIEKGKYVLTTSVCDAKYTSSKNISKDIVISLNTSEL